MPGNPIVQGDSRHISDLGFRPNSVDCFITSPPYVDLKRYDADAPNELGHNQSFDDYLDDLGSIFGSCHKLAKKTGVMWLVADTVRRPAPSGGLGELDELPFRMAEAARKVGWRLQEIVIWEKNKTLPYSGQGKLRNLIEYVLLLTKTQTFKHRPFRLAGPHGSEAEWLSGWPERYHPLGKRPANVWRIPIPTQGNWAHHSDRLHFCPFPQELVARCIELTTDKGDLVVDPFAGVGSVPAQALAMGRIGRGVELNQSFIQVFEQQLLPEFQAEWESNADARRLKRDDQLREATLIFTLRALKAGKELSKYLERISHDGTLDAPVDAVESILVEAPNDYERYLNVDEGLVGKPPVTLTVITNDHNSNPSPLEPSVQSLLSGAPFSTLGLDLTVAFVRWTDLAQRVHTSRLFEYDQSRRATYTHAIDLANAKHLPRLLSTVGLGRVIHGDKLSPLEYARKEAEKRVLNAELSLADGPEELALRLGLPGAEIRELLLEHGLDHAQQTFGIPINDYPAYGVSDAD